MVAQCSMNGELLQYIRLVDQKTWNIGRTDQIVKSRNSSRNSFEKMFFVPCSRLCALNVGQAISIGEQSIDWDSG